MWIDIGVTIVFGFALFGLFAGFWSQLLRVGALISLYWATPPVAQHLEEPVAALPGETLPESAASGAALG